MNNPNEMLAKKVWAVVGASNKKAKFGYKIFKTLQDAGFQVYPVNPGIQQIMGCDCYSSLKELPIKPEAVNLVVPPDIGKQVIEECEKLSITNVWFQPGADGDEVVRRACELGFNVVANACIMVEIKKQNIK